MSLPEITYMAWHEHDSHAMLDIHTDRQTPTTSVATRKIEEGNEEASSALWCGGRAISRLPPALTALLTLILPLDRSWCTANHLASLVD
jgi:hypothetical protein